MPDKLIQCAAVYGWIYMSTSDNDKKAKSKEWINIYTNAAADLTSHEYTFEKFKIYLEDINYRIFAHPDEAQSFLASETTRCSKVENLGEDVVNKLNELVKQKRSTQ